MKYIFKSHKKHTILLSLVPKEYTLEEHTVLCIIAETWEKNSSAEKKSWQEVVGMRK